VINWLRKLYVLWFARVDPKMKCPACGARKLHRILFSVHTQQVVHSCGECSAQWAEPPVVKAEFWAGKPASLEAEAAKAAWIDDGKPSLVHVGTRLKGQVVETTKQVVQR
jgi:ribosomal protein L37AE/L43A